MPPSTRYKQNWTETQERFERWWHCRPTDRPLMSIDAPRDRPLGNTPPPRKPKDPAQQYLNADYLIQATRSYLERSDFGSDALPEVTANFGPGSLALYLGAEPGFARDTVWFKPCIQSLDKTPLPQYDPNNRWLRAHLELFRKLRDAFGADAWLTIPDIIESTDVLSAMRGPADFLYDLMDRPKQCHRWLKRINSLYQVHYDAFYDIVKDDEGGSVFTAFHIWGPGRTVKVQCDFSAMISPAQLGEFFIPYVKKQIERLDRVLFHLDGPSCIRHVDQLLKLERLHAIQWVSGAGAAPHEDERWHPLYEKILKGGKGLHVALPADAVEAFIRRFGARGVYILTSVKSAREAAELMALAKRAS
jgi:5-methyltetrahydrofolate--homocysteine methyltransferase